MAESVFHRTDPKLIARTKAAIGSRDLPHNPNITDANSCRVAERTLEAIAIVAIHLQFFGTSSGQPRVCCGVRGVVHVIRTQSYLSPSFGRSLRFFFLPHAPSTTQPTTPSRAINTRRSASSTAYSHRARHFDEEIRALSPPFTRR